MTLAAEALEEFFFGVDRDKSASAPINTGWGTVVSLSPLAFTKEGETAWTYVTAVATNAPVEMGARVFYLSNGTAVTIVHAEYAASVDEVDIPWEGYGTVIVTYPPIVKLDGESSNVQASTVVNNNRLMVGTRVWCRRVGNDVTIVNSGDSGWNSFDLEPGVSGNGEWKLREGVVYVRGDLRTTITSGWQTLGSMPVDFAPSRQIYAAATRTGDTFGALYLGSNGLLRCKSNDGTKDRVELAAIPPYLLF